MGRVTGNTFVRDVRRKTRLSVTENTFVSEPRPHSALIPQQMARMAVLKSLSFSDSEMAVSEARDD
jgi:hypothetical protein